MKIKKISGKKIKNIFLYALSTCVWCKKTKSFLNDLGVEYEYIDVDKLEDHDRKIIKEDLKKWNPACSFPTLVLDDKECILGYEPDEIKEKLGI